MHYLFYFYNILCVKNIFIPMVKKALPNHRVLKMISGLNSPHIWYFGIFNTPLKTLIYDAFKRGRTRRRRPCKMTSLLVIQSNCIKENWNFDCYVPNQYQHFDLNLFEEIFNMDHVHCINTLYTNMFKHWLLKIKKSFFNFHCRIIALVFLYINCYLTSCIFIL